MDIPDFQSFLLPVLRLASSRDVRTKDSLDAISDEFGLTEEERDTPLPSGKRTVVASRLSWALYYLARAGMLENKVRGVYSITQKGQDLLSRGFEKLPPRFYGKNLLSLPHFTKTSGKERSHPTGSVRATSLKTQWRRVRKKLWSGHMGYCVTP